MGNYKKITKPIASHEDLRINGVMPNTLVKKVQIEKAAFREAVLKAREQLENQEDEE